MNSCFFCPHIVENFCTFTGDRIAFISVQINGVQLLPPRARGGALRAGFRVRKTSVLRTGRCQRLTLVASHGFSIPHCWEKDRRALAAFLLQANDGLLVVTAAIPVSTKAQTRTCLRSCVGGMCHCVRAVLSDDLSGSCPDY